MPYTPHNETAEPQEPMQPSVNSRQRVIDHGEVYTPPGLVSNMLDLVQGECERIESRFLEPACGNGNFLAEVLQRKLRTVDKQHARNRQRWERDAILAVSSVYGIDLLPDNVAECRERLLKVVGAAHESGFKEPLPEPARKAAGYILKLNIVQGDALTYLTPSGESIVFSEWSPVNGMLLKRRDFKFGQLLEHAETAVGLFSDYGEAVWLPEPVGERPPCHYLQVADAEVKS